MVDLLDNPFEPSERKQSRSLGEIIKALKENGTLQDSLWFAYGWIL